MRSNLKSIYEATMAKYQHIRRQYDDRHEIVFEKYIRSNNGTIATLHMYFNNTLIDMTSNPFNKPKLMLKEK